MAIAITPDQQALQASLRDWAKQAHGTPAQRDRFTDPAITWCQMFNEVFLDEVFVPDECVLGAPGDGWRIAMSTLASERVAIGTGQDEEVQTLLAAGGAENPFFSERTGVHVATALSLAALSLAALSLAALSLAALGERGAHPAIRKLIGTAHRQAVAETVLELLGPAGAVEGEASEEFLLTRCLSIAGGTTQILLNQVGERVLGLPPVMDFTPTESGQAVAALAAEILTEPDPWKALARAGLLDASSLGVLDLTVLLTEIGRRAPSTRALATLITGALPVARWGSDELKQRLLPGVASGELLLTAALREPSDPQPIPPATTITNGTLTGTKLGVPHAGQASLILVPARLSGPPIGVALLSPRAAGVEVVRTPSSSGEPEFTLRMDGAPIEGMLGGADCVRDLHQLAVAGACALADGAVAGALALTRDHVATREQFGRPLAAFQAVSQQIAEVYIASRTMHLATLAACWRLDAGPKMGPEMDSAAGADLGVAGYWCAEQAPRSVRTCHHLHGGLGMDATYPLHRFSGLVADLVRYLGGAEYRLTCIST